MEYIRYMKPKNATKPQPSSRVLKAAYTTALVSRMPISSHGLNLP